MGGVIFRTFVPHVTFCDFFFTIVQFFRFFFIFLIKIFFVFFYRSDGDVIIFRFSGSLKKDFRSSLARIVSLRIFLLKFYFRKIIRTLFFVFLKSKQFITVPQKFYSTFKHSKFCLLKNLTQALYLGCWSIC